jgi:outer membrane protein OmpA-like peptidoglycan-associated protein/opacity protein-like surface antigen
MRVKAEVLLMLGITIPAMFAAPFRAEAQSAPQFKLLDTTRYDFAVGYNNIRANAPPSLCGCFDMNGGFVFGSVHLTDWLAIEGEFTGGHSGHISPLGQDLTLTTFTGGPRFSHRFHKFTPYGEALVGGAHGSDSYFPSQNSSSASASGFAFSAGGGLDYFLTSRFSVRAFDAQYLRTSFPNGANNAQSQLMIGAGVVIKFQSHDHKPAVVPPPVHAEAPPPPPPPTVAFVCSTNAANVHLGEVVVITGNATSQPPSPDLTYSWSMDGGSIQGSGKTVSVDTASMTVGDYMVKGHASLASSPNAGADCVAVFRVLAPAPPPPASTTTIINTEERERDFHENVKDAYFDVNSAKINAATLATIIHAAQYLVAHPSIQVIISGWADPRGSVDFNLRLGNKRANAVRDALIEAGVPPSQLEVISNGKSSQVCTTNDKECWAKNRRVSYSMKP